MLLKSTTRHVLIYAAEVIDDELVPSESILTLDIDPDNEFNWTDETLKEVNQEFDRLVQESKGAELTDYNLRRIGSDLELFIKQLLQRGEISYNLNSRVLNYSMGLPKVVSDAEEDAS
jgi:NAD(P)H-quinone oxidoreductase subunit M